MGFAIHSNFEAEGRLVRKHKTTICHAQIPGLPTAWDSFTTKG